MARKKLSADELRRAAGLRDDYDEQCFEMLANEISPPSFIEWKKQNNLSLAVVKATHTGFGT